MSKPALGVHSSPTGRKLQCRSSRRDLAKRRSKCPSLTRCSICSRLGDPADISCTPGLRRSASPFSPSPRPRSALSNAVPSLCSARLTIAPIVNCRMGPVQQCSVLSRPRGTSRRVLRLAPWDCVGRRGPNHCAGHRRIAIRLRKNYQSIEVPISQFWQCIPQRCIQRLEFRPSIVAFASTVGKKGWRAGCGGRAVSDVLIYPLIVVAAFGVCYSIYGLGIAAVRLIRSLSERSATARWRPRRNHSPPGKVW